MNFLKKLWTEISNHNFCKSIAGILCVAVLLWCYGCPVKCNSILHPGTKITGPELQTEIDNFYARASLEANSLAQQEELRRYLFEQSMIVAQTGVFSWFQVLTGLGSILGLGAVADNIRYRIKFPSKSNA